MRQAPVAGKADVERCIVRIPGWSDETVVGEGAHAGKWASCPPSRASIGGQMVRRVPAGANTIQMAIDLGESEVGLGPTHGSSDGEKLTPRCDSSETPNDGLEDVETGHDVQGPRPRRAAAHLTRQRGGLPRHVQLGRSGAPLPLPLPVPVPFAPALALARLAPLDDPRLLATPRPSCRLSRRFLSVTSSTPARLPETRRSVLCLSFPSSWKAHDISAGGADVGPREGSGAGKGGAERRGREAGQRHRAKGARPTRQGGTRQEWTRQGWTGQGWTGRPLRSG